MQQNTHGQTKFLIDAEIGDDDVTLPSLPAVDVPIVEQKTEHTITATEVPLSETEEDQPKKGFFGRMKEGLTQKLVKALLMEWSTF